MVSYKALNTSIRRFGNIGGPVLDIVEKCTYLCDVKKLFGSIALSIT